jgi:hypothetical protein
VWKRFYNKQETRSREGDEKGREYRRDRTWRGKEGIQTWGDGPLTVATHIETQ